MFYDGGINEHVFFVLNPYHHHFHSLVFTKAL